MCRIIIKYEILMYNFMTNNFVEGGKTIRATPDELLEIKWRRFRLKRFFHQLYWFDLTDLGQNWHSYLFLLKESSRVIIDLIQCAF